MLEYICIRNEGDWWQAQAKCNVNRVRLSVTTNACWLINVTFKRQKSPKFIADGRMHEEIRGQASWCFSINFDLYDTCLAIFPVLKMSQTFYALIYTQTLQMYQQTMFDLESKFGLRVPLFEVFHIWQSICLLVLATFKCLKPASLICKAINSGSSCHFLITKFVIPASSQVLPFWTEQKPLWKGEIFQISLFVASWLLQLVNDLVAWVTTNAVVKDLPVLWQTVCHPVTDTKKHGFWLLHCSVLLCTLLEVKDKHLWESI